MWVKLEVPEPSNDDPSNKISNEQSPYRFHAYVIDDMTALCRLELCVAEELYECEDNHKGLLL